MTQYCFLKVNIPGFPGDYWVYTQMVRGFPNLKQSLVVREPLFADAYLIEEVKRETAMLNTVFPGCIVSVVECGPEALPADARQILNLVKE